MYKCQKLGVKIVLRGYIQELQSAFGLAQLAQIIIFEKTMRMTFFFFSEESPHEVFLLQELKQAKAEESMFNWPTQKQMVYKNFRSKTSFLKCQDFDFCLRFPSL